MSSKLYENSQNYSQNRNNSSSISSNTNNNNFPKIKSSSDVDKPESVSQLSENDYLKLLKQVKNKKISIDDRKTNSGNQNRIEEGIVSKVKRN